MKRHLTSTGKKGPRCPGLKRPLSPKEWQESILPYYVDNAELPNLPTYKKRGRPRVNKMSDIPKRSRRKRLSSDGLLSDDGVPTLSRDTLLEMLRQLEDPDGRWILRTWEKLGSKGFRQLATAPVVEQKQNMALTAKIKDCKARNNALSNQMTRLEGRKRPGAATTTPPRPFSDLKRAARYKRCHSLNEAVGEPTRPRR